MPIITESPQGKPKPRNAHVWREKHLPLRSRRNVRIGILSLLLQNVSAKL